MSSRPQNKRRTRAVFLDRDGTINWNPHHLRRVRDLRMLPGAAQAIRNLNHAGFRVIVVTNQGGVAKGLLTEQALKKIHDVFITRLSKAGATIDAIYYCPHHPEGIRRNYRRRCVCRKPNTGMVKQAARDFSINLRRSFMVGDMTADILLGRRAGLRTVLLKTGFGGTDGRHQAKPHYVVKDLLAAAKLILKHA